MSKESSYVPTPKVRPSFLVMKFVELTTGPGTHLKKNCARKLNDPIVCKENRWLAEHLFKCLFYSIGIYYIETNCLPGQRELAEIYLACLRLC